MPITWYVPTAAVNVLQTFCIHENRMCGGKHIQSSIHHLTIIFLYNRMSVCERHILENV